MTTMIFVDTVDQALAYCAAAVDDTDVRVAASTRLLSELLTRLVALEELVVSLAVHKATEGAS